MADHRAMDEEADANDNNLDDGDDEGAMPCPICGKPVNPGAAQLCPHYLCILGDEGFDWFAPDLIDFRETVSTLVSTMEERDVEDTEWLAAAPQAVRTLHEQIISSGDWRDDYWTHDSDIKQVQYATGFTLFLAYFHPQAQRFTRHVNTAAEDAVRWLEKHAHA